MSQLRGASALPDTPTAPVTADSQAVLFSAYLIVGSKLRIQYQLSGVTIGKVDLERLWTEATSSVFTTPVPASDRVDYASVDVETGTGRHATTISDDNLKRILEGVFLRPVITEIRMYISSEPKDEKPANEPYARELELSLSREDRAAIQLDGAEDWIHQTKNRLDSFLNQHSNHNDTYRIIAFLTVVSLLATIIGVPVYHFLISRVDPTLISPPYVVVLDGLISVPFASLSWYIITFLYPLTVFNLENRKDQPWYIRAGREVIIGIIVILVLAALGSVLGFYQSLLR
jgi:hypothetical protein